MKQINAIGRRKTSVARVFISETKDGKGGINVNGKDYKEYFPTLILQYIVNQPLNIVKDKINSESLLIQANINGGGIKGQSEALRLGIARAFVKIDSSLKPLLKQNGLLTRDPRMVERKKPGQRKARKRFQFSKR